MKILIVEDEDTIREVEKAYLLRANYAVDEATNGKEALDLFRANKYDLVILDLNLPEIDGVEVCKVIRRDSKVPIIMVTARVEEMDELIGLEIGADDYLKKPFGPNILVARVQSLLRRVKPEIIEIDGLSIDSEKMNVTVSGEDINLTTTQFNILHLLASNPGKVFTRDEILNRAYETSLPNYVLDRTVDAHIKGIRKLIEQDSKKPKFILTVIGRGYKFNDI